MDLNAPDRLRRRLLQRLTVLPVLVAAAHAQAAPVAQTWPLWPEDAPGGGGPVGAERVDAKGAVSHIARPSMTRFRPDRPNGSALLIAAGGGYKRIENGNEAFPAARWLTRRGITAYVLDYRLPGEGWHVGAVAPLQDAQRAVRLIRASAESKFARIGLLGFSAGGHLLGLAATRPEFRSYLPVDDTDRLPAGVDAAALIYPVVTLEPPFDQTSTRRQLVGEHPTLAESAAWSVQTHVAAQDPPMFLVQAEDDPISNPQNTRLLAAACQAAGVPVEMHRFTSGGHGFGMGRAGTPTVDWPDLFDAWLRARGFID